MALIPWFLHLVLSQKSEGPSLCRSRTCMKVFSIFIRNHTLEHNDYIHYIDGRIVFDKNKNKPCVAHGINNRVLDNLCYKNNIILTQDHIKNISQGDVKNILYYSKIFILVIIIIFMIYFLKKR